MLLLRKETFPGEMILQELANSILTEVIISRNIIQNEIYITLSIFCSYVSVIISRQTLQQEFNAIIDQSLCFKSQ